MQRIRAFALLLVLAGCGQQAPAPVVFNHVPVQTATPSGLPPATAQVGHGMAPASVALVNVAPAPMQGDIEVQRGDTLYALSRRHQVPVRSLIEANDLQAPYVLQPGQRLRLPGQRFHVVQRGETLYAISRAYDVDMYSLAQANDLPQPYLLGAGQSLRIPSSGQSISGQPISSGTTVAAAPQTYGADTSAAQTIAPANTPSSAPATSSAGGVTMEALPPPSAAPAPATQPTPAPQQTAVAPLPVPRAPAPSQAQQAPQAQSSQPQQPQAQAQAPVQPQVQPQAAAEPEPQAAPQVAAVPPVPAQIPAPAPAAPAATVTPPSQPAPRADADSEPPPRSGRSFAWPVRGRILSTFGTKPDGTHNDGLNIAARAGAPVIAAENGVVVYQGSELRGFGNLLLLRHADGWITAYAHLDRVLVKKGQRVTRGQAIATVGTSGGVDLPQLHFEIRRGTQAVDPAKFLSVALLDGGATPQFAQAGFSAWLSPAARPGGQPNPG